MKKKSPETRMVMVRAEIHTVRNYPASVPISPVMTDEEIKQAAIDMVKQYSIPPYFVPKGEELRFSAMGFAPENVEHKNVKSPFSKK